MYYFIVRMAFNGIVRDSPSFATSPGRKPGFITFYSTEWNEISKRLRDTVILNKDFETVIESYDTAETLFYLDPPYFMDGSDGYYEMEFDRHDHERLAQVLEGIHGQFILSYDDDSLIRDIYSSYNILKIAEKELLITNFKPKPGGFYRAPRAPREHIGAWENPNCPYCDSRRVKQVSERVTYEDGRRNWIPCGFKCIDCKEVYR